MKIDFVDYLKLTDPKKFFANNGVGNLDDLIDDHLTLCRSAQQQNLLFNEY